MNSATTTTFYRVYYTFTLGMFITSAEVRSVEATKNEHGAFVGVDEKGTPAWGPVLHATRAEAEAERVRVLQKDLTTQIDRLCGIEKQLIEQLKGA